MKIYNCSICNLKTENKQKYVRHLAIHKPGYAEQHYAKCIKASKSNQLRMQKIKEEAIIDYNEHPNFCKRCNSIIAFENKRNLFCSHTCAAIYNNNKRLKKDDIKPSYLIELHNTLEYIQADSATRRSLSIRASNLAKGKFSVRQKLIDIYGEKCSVCGIESVWMNLPLTLHVDHIDGNHQNNNMENVRLLCPNCHSQTKNYAGRNKKHHGQKNAFSVADKELLNALLESSNISQALTKVDLAPKAGNYERCKRLLDEYYSLGRQRIELCSVD